jgi:hypothetical protein
LSPRDCVVSDDSICTYDLSTIDEDYNRIIIDRDFSSNQSNIYVARNVERNIGIGCLVCDLRFSGYSPQRTVIEIIAGYIAPNMSFTDMNSVYIDGNV